MISFSLLSAVGAASNYLGSLSGSSNVPPTTEQIESVHQQLSKWQTQDPPILRSNLKSVLSKHIATETKPISDHYPRYYQGISDANPVDTTYGEIRASLNPSNAPAEKSTDHEIQAKWAEFIKHDTNFERATKAYRGAQNSLSLLHGYTGTSDMAYTDFLKEVDERNIGGWLDSFVSLVEASTKNGMLEQDSQKIGADS